MLVHTNVVLARIREIPALASKTYALIAPKDANGKLPASPFGVLYPADGIDTAERLSGPRSAQHPRFTLHVVGSSYENVATVTALIKARFVDEYGAPIPLVIPGWLVSDFQWSSPIPIQLDRDVSPPIPFQVIELGFTADPA